MAVRKGGRKRGGARASTPASTPSATPPAGVPLHTVMIAFQKALARAGEDTVQQKQRDPLFLLGQRTLYGVHAIDVELRAELLVVAKADASTSDLVFVQFEGPPDRRSTLRFRVDPVPLEAARGPGVILPDVPADDEGKALQRMRAIAVDEAGNAEPSVMLTIKAERVGTKDKPVSLSAITDDEGCVEFDIDLAKGDLRARVPGVDPVRLPGPGKHGPWRIWVERTITRPDTDVSTIIRSSERRVELEQA